MTDSQNATAAAELELEALRARIAALETENKALNERNQKLVLSHKLSPHLPRRSSADSNSDGKRKTCVTFDGYKTRVDQAGDDGGQQAETLNKLPPQEVSSSSEPVRRFSSMSLHSDVSASEKDLDAYLERLCGDESEDESESSGNGIKEPQDDGSTGKRVSFSPRESGKGLSEISESNEVSGEEEPHERKARDFRRSSLIGSQCMSNLTLSSDGNKVHYFGRKDDPVHFTLGQKKNRYTMKVEEFLQLSEHSATGNKSSSSSIQRPLLTRSRSDSNVSDHNWSENPDKDEGMPMKSRHSCPTINRRVSTVLGRMSSVSKMLSVSMRTTQAGALPISPPQRLSFQQFMLLTVDPLVDQNKGSLEWAADGVSFLDPFVLKSPHCVDKYPYLSSGDSFSPDELSAFCCGDGVKVRLVPRIAASGATRLGWMGPKAKQYKLLVFTNGDGTATHGVAITVTSQISTGQPSFATLVRDLEVQQAKRNASRKISKWWRASLMAKRIDEVSLNSTPDVGEFRASLDNGTRLRSRLKEGRLRSSLRASATGRIQKIKKKIASKQPTFKKKRTKAGGIPDGDACNGNHTCVEVVYEAKPTPVSERATALGKESFDMMEQAATMGDTLIVEKCYVLIGCEESEQYLILRSLQHLVDIERENLKLGSQKKASRHGYLNVIQKCMSLSPSQARVQLPRNDLDILTQSPPSFEIELPSFSGLDKLKLNIPLPLPNIAGSWGVAALVHHVKISDLLCILNLLLVERPVFIIGTSSDKVTSCTCALLTLLQPFRWASNFMPLLPEEMLDFVNSPVPFIIGMVARNVRHSEEIVGDDRVQEAIREGLSVVNLDTGIVHLTSEAGMKSMVQKCPAPRSKLSHYQRRLETLRNYPNASLGSFSLFIQFGLSRKEIVTLNALRNLIRHHVTSYAGDIEKKWRQYGKYNKAGTFDFYPSLFIEPIREHSESQLQLQEMMAHSQLFVEFVDQQQKDSATKMNKRKGDIMFISSWIYIHWRRKKKRQMTC